MKTDLVVAGYLIHEGKVLLIHHRKLNLWLPVGGHIDPDESPDDALVREFREEVGVDVRLIMHNDLPPGGNIKRQLAVPFYVNIHSVGDHDHVCFYYVCRSTGSAVIAVNERELHGARWFAIDELDGKDVPLDVRNMALQAFSFVGRN